MCVRGVVMSDSEVAAAVDPGQDLQLKLRTPFWNYGFLVTIFIHFHLSIIEQLHWYFSCRMG